MSHIVYLFNNNIVLQLHGEVRTLKEIVMHIVLLQSARRICVLLKQHAL